MPRCICTCCLISRFTFPLQCITPYRIILFLLQEPGKMSPSPWREFVIPFLTSGIFLHVSLFCDGCFPGIHSPFLLPTALRLSLGALSFLHCQDVGVGLALDLTKMMGRHWPVLIRGSHFPGSGDWVKGGLSLSIQSEHRTLLCLWHTGIASLLCLVVWKYEAWTPLTIPHHKGNFLKIQTSAMKSKLNYPLWAKTRQKLPTYLPSFLIKPT